MSKRKKVVIRTNVLTLMGAAYTVLLIMFFVLIFCTKSISAKEAWEIMQAPLMALIGGTLAISKDLIQDDDNVSPEKDPKGPKDKNGQPDQ